MEYTYHLKWTKGYKLNQIVYWMHFDMSFTACQFETWPETTFTNVWQLVKILMSCTYDRKMTYHIIIDLLRLYFHLSLSPSLSSPSLLKQNKTKRTLLMIWVKSTDPYLNSLFKRFILIMIIANICTMLLFYTCCYYKLTLKFSITSFIATLLFSNIGKLCYFINKQQQLADSCNTFDK